MDTRSLDLVLPSETIVTTLVQPPPCKWAWTFDGFTVWHVPAGKEPNRLHRFMLRHVLGIRWRKLSG